MIAALSTLIAGEMKLHDREGTRPVAPPLSIGEVVDATIKEKQGGKYVIMVKGISMEASSNVPLGEGQKISLRISQLYPKILMIPVTGEESPAVARQVLEHVKIFKQDPAMLGSIFQRGKDIFSREKMAQYKELMPATDFQAIKDHLEGLIFSKDDLGGYARRLGLCHEHVLASGTGIGDNLKAAMMKLQEDIDSLLSGKSTAGDALAELSEFAALTVGKIETCQVVNCLSVDREGLFFLPIPFLLKDDLRIGEFYASKKETVRGKEFRAVLFLDMDNLGKIMADIKLTDASMKCAFRCEDVGARDFLSERIGFLKEGLEAL
jgi:hypothetical protein